MNQIQTETSGIDQNKVVNLKEVQRIIGKSKGGVYQDIKKGLLPKYKIGNSTRFYLGDVYSMMKKEVK